MAFKGCSSTLDPITKRPLGHHEIYLRNCHSKLQGAMNQLCGLTLVTRHPIDEGMKIDLCDPVNFGKIHHRDENS